MCSEPSGAHTLASRYLILALITTVIVVQLVEISKDLSKSLLQFLHIHLGVCELTRSAIFWSGYQSKDTGKPHSSNASKIYPDNKVERVLHGPGEDYIERKTQVLSCNDSLISTFYKGWITILPDCLKGYGALHTCSFIQDAHINDFFKGV